MIDFTPIKKIFEHCQILEQKYQKIIELGRALPPLPECFKVPENIVKGCQSIVYLHAEIHEGKLFFYAASDALISSGLAAILVQAYNGQSPETVLKCKPVFLEELGIYAALTPSRSNGLASMYLRMQQEALKFLISV